MAAKKGAAAPEKKFDVNSYSYSDCREQHVWEHFDGSIDEKVKIAFQVMKCSRCPTKRHRAISMRTKDYGDVLRSFYRYPKDYAIPGGIDHHDRGRIRMHNFLANYGAVNSG